MDVRLTRCLTLHCGNDRTTGNHETIHPNPPPDIIRLRVTHNQVSGDDQSAFHKSREFNYLFIQFTFTEILV